MFSLILVCVSLLASPLPVPTRITPSTMSTLNFDGGDVGVGVKKMQKEEDDEK